MTGTCPGTCLDPKCTAKITYILACEGILASFGLPPQICSPIIYGITYSIPLSGATVLTSYFGFTSNSTKESIVSPIKFPYEILNDNPEPELARTFYKVEPSEKMIGDSGLNNLMVANKNTKHIWPKNVAKVDLENSSGEVNLYYSLCSTKITDGKVGIVKNFNKASKMKDTVKMHEINFFCSVESPSLDEVLIVPKKFDNQDYTCIEVRDTVVCLVGKVDINIDDIGITNKTYIDSVFTDAII